MNPLTKILEYAIENVEGYSSLKNNLSEFPIIDRFQLQCSSQRFISKKYKNCTDQLMVKTSSGSSGRPLSIYWDTNSYLSSMHTLWKYRRIYYNIYPMTKRLDFTLDSSLDRWYIIQRTGISVSRKIIYDASKIEELLHLVKENYIEWIYIQPHVASALAIAIVNNNLLIPKSIRYIEFVGEILTPSIRKYVESVFKCPTSNMYGSEEMNGIAYECPCHTMHVLNDNVHIEIIGTVEGEAILTSLQNYAMPLIRYCQGDIISLRKDYICSCGRTGDVVSVIQGRSYEKISVTGDTINPYVLIDVMEYINRLIGGEILEYKLEYNTREQICRLYIVPISIKRIANYMRIVSKVLIDKNIIQTMQQIIVIDKIPCKGKYSVIEVT